VFSIEFAMKRMACRGDLMDGQASFVNEAVQFIMNVYLKKTTPVLLVAHSMGGLVGRAIVMQDNYQPGSVSALITFGTPHRPTCV